MAFGTVGEVVSQVRVLIQDTDADGYRYSTASVYDALNEGLLESKRLRPDFFYGTAMPQYDAGDSSDTINYPDIYIPALINYVCGRVQLRDDEATMDERAGVLITSFRQTLTAG
jgi:hypothetical protein